MRSIVVALRGAIPTTSSGLWLLFLVLGASACGGPLAPITVTLSSESLSLSVGGTITLTASAVDANLTAVAAAPIWTSDNADIATVRDGVVTAVGPGTTRIRASVAGATGGCEVTVIPVLTGFWIADSDTLGIFALRLTETVGGAGAPADNPITGEAFIQEGSLFLEVWGQHRYPDVRLEFGVDRHTVSYVYAGFEWSSGGGVMIGGFDGGAYEDLTINFTRRPNSLCGWVICDFSP